jgi:hypothetical protein
MTKNMCYVDTIKIQINKIHFYEVTCRFSQLNVPVRDTDLCLALSMTLDASFFLCKYICMLINPSALRLKIKVQINMRVSNFESRRIIKNL